MNAKEAMFTKMAGMLGDVFPKDTTATNPVAQFLSDEFDTIFEGNEIIKPLKAKVVEIANEDPNKVLAGLVRIHNDIGALVVRLHDAEDLGVVVGTVVEEPDDAPDTE